MYSHVGRFRVLEGAMPTVQKSLRIPDEVAKAIEEAAELPAGTSRPWPTS